MPITPTDAVSPTGIFGTAATTPATSASTTTSTSQDKDMFLQLLVAQLRYQDPMNPTDSSEFLAQSAQFTALEKMQDVADQTAQLVASQMAFGASTLVGKPVGWSSEDGTPHTGTVEGVEFGAQGPMLHVDGGTIPLAQVQTIGTTSGRAV